MLQSCNSPHLLSVGPSVGRSKTFIVYKIRVHTSPWRVGGTSVAHSEEFFHMIKLACFTLVRPRNPKGKITNLSSCSFYSHPRSMVRNKLAEFLVTSVGKLRGEHPGARFI